MLAAFLAEIIGTVVGFGTATVLLPIAVLIFDFKVAIVLVAFMHVFGNTAKIGFFKHGLNWNILLKFGLPSVVFAYFGAVMIAHLDQTLLAGLLGIFLVTYSLFAAIEKKMQIKTGLKTLLLGGSISGFLAGLIGTGGALRGAFLSSYNLSKKRYIATMSAVALAVDITRIPVYLGEGFLQDGYVYYLPVLAVLAILGAWAGKMIVDRVPQDKFRFAVLAGLFIVGLKFIADWL